MAVYSSGKKGRKSNLRHIFKDDCHQKWYLRSVTGTCWWADWANTKQTAIWERCPWYVRWDKPGASAAPFVFQKGGNGRIPHITMCIGSNWASSLLFYREQLEVNRQPLTVSFNGGGGSSVNNTAAWLSQFMTSNLFLADSGCEYTPSTWSGFFHCMCEYLPILKAADSGDTPCVSSHSKHMSSHVWFGGEKHLQMSDLQQV